MGVNYSNPVNYDQVQIILVIFTCSWDWTCNYQIISLKAHCNQTPYPQWHVSLLDNKFIIFWKTIKETSALLSYLLLLAGLLRYLLVGDAICCHSYTSWYLKENVQIFLNSFIRTKLLSTFSQFFYSQYKSNLFCLMNDLNCLHSGNMTFYHQGNFLVARWIVTRWSLLTVKISKILMWHYHSNTKKSLYLYPTFLVAWCKHKERGRLCKGIGMYLAYSYKEAPSLTQRLN